MERLFELMQQDILDKAATQSEEGAVLLRQGKQAEAKTKLGEATHGIEQTKLVDSLRADILTRLQQAGIEQPTVDYLKRLIPEGLTVSPTAPPAQETVKIPQETPPVIPTTGTEPEKRPSLLNEEVLRRYSPTEQRILNHISQDPQAPIEKGQLARMCYPTEQDLNKAKGKLGVAMSGMKGKLTEDKLVIANPLREAGFKSPKTRASYYLTRQAVSQESSKDEPQPKRGPGRPRKNTSAPATTKATGESQPSTSEVNNLVESNKLGAIENYLLAKSLAETTQEELSEIGINLTEEDRQEIAATHRRLEPASKDPQQITQASERLLRILSAYINDKQKVFMDNIDNEDAQFLLATLAPIQSDEDLQKLKFDSNEGQEKDDYLKPYQDIISTLSPDKGVRITLQEGETVESIIANAERAANKVGKKIKITPEENNTLILQVDSNFSPEGEKNKEKSMPNSESQEVTKHLVMFQVCFVASKLFVIS